MSKSRISFSAGSSARGNSRANTTQVQFNDKINGKVNQHIGGLVSVRGITNRRTYGTNQNMIFPMNRIGGVGRSFRSSQDGSVSFEPYSWPLTSTEEPPSFLDNITFDFNQYNDGPISNQNTGVLQLAGSKTTQWSGGTYGANFTNDSTDEESIVSVSSCSGGNKAWRIQHVYGNGVPGTPYSPYTNYEAGFTNEASFKADIIGKQQITTFYIKSEPITATPGTFHIYNGNYAGNDRTGFNVNIEQQAGGLRLFSYTYNNGSFIATDISPLLPYNTCNKIVVNTTYTDSNPDNDKFFYSVNNSPPIEVLSWPNVWRKANNFTPSYGTRLTIYAPNAGANPVSSGLLIDGINIKINETPEPVIVPFAFSLITPNTTTSTNIPS
jgi:hypothetical protein